MEIAKKPGWLQPLLIKRTGGFTLIEIIMSIALIAIGILGFSLSTAGIIQGNFISGNYTIATSLAQDKMEELLGKTSLTNVDNCTNPPDQDITATGGTGGIYDRCWKITGANLKQIDVTVNWLDYRDRTVTLSTLVFTK